jgi:Tol biopolymer transport system component
VPVVEGVATIAGSGSTQIAISEAGTAVYLPGASETNEVPVSWLDRTGNTTVRSAPANWSNPGFSPDGERLAMDVFDGSQVDVWTYDIARDTMTRLTFDAADDVRPVWSPDGRRIAFASRRGTKAPFSVYWQRADGTGDVQPLVKGTNDLYPGSFHPSGKFFAYFEMDAKTAGNLMILPIEGDEATGFAPERRSNSSRRTSWRARSRFRPMVDGFAFSAESVVRRSTSVPSRSRRKGRFRTARLIRYGRGHETFTRSVRGSPDGCAARPKAICFGREAQALPRHELPSTTSAEP